MKIKRTCGEHSRRVPLSTFAESNDLTLHVHQHADGHYSACFEGAEIADGRILSSTIGRGMTEGFAIADYVERISGKILVLNPCGPGRVDIPIPSLLIPTLSPEDRAPR